MRQLFKTALIGLVVATSSAMAEPEMRCLSNGAYIKLYGKTTAEKRATCERQGGELTSYVPHQGQGGDNQRAKAMESIFGRGGVGR